MSQRNIKFIATDMDGTLLNGRGQLDPEFFTLHPKLVEKDIIFAAASGRQYYSLLDTFSDVKDQIMFIAENGTLVMHKGQELYSLPLDSAVINDLIAAARSIDGAHIVLCGKRSAYIETEDQRAREEVQKYYHRCEIVEDLTTIEDDFLKVAICHFEGSEKHIFPVINPAFGDTQKVVVSAKIWLDVMNPAASKGDAISYLQNQLGFTSQETMSFGDYFNDVEMLQASYHSYAVENAHDEVKSFARFSAPSNDDSGVLVVLKELLKELD